MKILVVATRDPRGRATGRKLVLRTIIDSLTSLGHAVELVVVARKLETDGGDFGASVTLHQVPPARMGRILLNVLGGAVPGRRSLNESLYWSPRTARAIARIARDQHCDMVVADMIRTVSLAEVTGLPVIVDLDDLLSKRYRDMASAGADPRLVLGYYGESLPSIVRRVLAPTARLGLRWEAWLLSRREIAAARRADVVSLVSAREAVLLERSSGVPVETLPMAVDVPELRTGSRGGVNASGVFVGGLDFYPNHCSLRWFVDEVMPHLRDSDFTLTVVGHHDEVARSEFAHDRVRLTGYVDDLVEELGRHDVFIAPIRSGTGVKTKVLDAMAAGLPVVTTHLGVDGIGARSGAECVIAEAPAEFAAAILEVLGDLRMAETIGSAGRDLVVRKFSRDVVRERWRHVIERVGTPGQV